MGQEQEWRMVQGAIPSVPLLLRTNSSILPTERARGITGRSSQERRKELPHVARRPSLWRRAACSSTAVQVSRESVQNALERQFQCEEEAIKASQGRARAARSQEYGAAPPLSDTRTGQDAARALPRIY